MKRSHVCRQSFRFRFVAVGAALAAVLGPLAGLVSGSQSVKVVRIEEDWELVVLNPETSNNSPQITCAMSPSVGDDGNYVSFELNHQSQPGYLSGGLHLHAWNGDYLLATSHTQAGTVLETQSETVSWTQAMSVSNGVLSYEVINGTSQTWGAFGTGELSLSVATNLQNLNRYDVNNSLSGSGVGYGANRVSSLVLKSVRFFLDSGEVVEVHPNQNVLGN